MSYATSAPDVTTAPAPVIEHFAASAPGGASDQVFRARASCVLRGVSSNCVRCASANDGVHHASTRGRVHRASASCVLRGVSTCFERCASASGREHRDVSTAPVAKPSAMSFTVPLTGSAIVATASFVTMCSALTDCTDTVSPICSGGVCVAMSWLWWCRPRFFTQLGNGSHHLRVVSAIRVGSAKKEVCIAQQCGAHVRAIG